MAVLDRATSEVLCTPISIHTRTPHFSIAFYCSNNHLAPILLFASLRLITQGLPFRASAYTYYDSILLIYSQPDLNCCHLHLLYLNNVKNLHSGNRLSGILSHLARILWGLRSIIIDFSYE